MANNEVMRLWAEDLETTDAKQGLGFLTTVDTEFTGVAGVERDCCLGRLCKLAVKAGVIPAPDLIDGRLVYQDANGEVNSRTLPKAVQEWSGLYEDDPLLDDTGDDRISASELNDSFGYTFDEIAAVIRRKYGV